MLKRTLSSRLLAGRVSRRALSTIPHHAKGDHQGWGQRTKYSGILLGSAFSAAALGTGSLITGREERVDAPKIKIPSYASREEMEQAVHDIREMLGEDAVSIEDEILRSHGYSDWSTINIDRLPVAVVFPKSTEEVSQIAKICYKYRVPIIPYSGGSSVEGHFSAPYGGILTIHQEDMNIEVQPSVSWLEMNEKIKDTGLFFPIDPGPSCKYNELSGMILTCSSGTNAVRYGTMRDWVVNLTVVLADGSIVKTRRRPRKSSAGYSLNSLFVGSEGTLGLVTEATLKLAPIPAENGVAVVTFPTIKDAASMAAEVINAGIPIGAVEILDDVLMRVINRIGNTPRKWAEVPTLFFKFSGSKVAVADSIEQVQKIAKKFRTIDYHYESDPVEQKMLWSARKEALWSMLALRKTDGHVWSTDVAVPLSRVAELIEVSKKDLDSLGLFGSVLGHVGDGNFHETILFEEKDREAVEQCVHKMVQRALEMEGTCTGEHGIGLGKKEMLHEELGEGPIELMRSIKKSMDPRWLMNPGKIFDYA
ncbi:FAD-linked oxidase-like protein [Bipolaris maydis]|nr:FAD-linked oxidase-like protein [Bipolaris maydis]KAJ6192449.1 FAD-linked oxidase-like protein [Bipolaris maydis]KAJ6215201.1 FAD-linked oxidase-like protein [Bipolaris maydis]